MRKLNAGGPGGPLGPQGAVGLGRPPRAADVETVVAVDQAPAQNAETTLVTCPPGKLAVGGGVSVNAFSSDMPVENLIVTVTLPVGVPPRGTVASNPRDQPTGYRVYAVCATVAT